MNVSEFSKRIGTSAHTIRYYDKAGLLDDVHRLPSGHRYFQEKDITWFKFIQRLKDTGMSIVQIREYASLRKAGDTTLAARQIMLKEHSVKLQHEIKTQQHHLKKLQEKIEFYQSAIDGKITLD